MTERKKTHLLYFPMFLLLSVYSSLSPLLLSSMYFLVCLSSFFLLVPIPIFLMAIYLNSCGVGGHTTLIFSLLLHLLLYLTYLFYVLFLRLLYALFSTLYSFFLPSPFVVLLTDFHFFCLLPTLRIRMLLSALQLYLYFFLSILSFVLWL